MSSEATKGQDPDQYGQLHPIETPELIARKRVEFEEHLQHILASSSSFRTELEGLKQAQEKCPQLLTDDFKLIFLRCEVFNADLAAQRYVHYWEKRLEIFGPEKAFQPLTLDQALSEDWTALNMGFAQWIPNVKDPQGRSIVFINPANQDSRKYESKSMVRAFWYMVHAALVENEQAQKHGVVFVGYGRDAKLSQFDRELGRLNISSLQGAIPVRLAAIHLCRPPSFFKVVFAFMKLFMKERTKKRILVHFGNQDQVLEKLAKYGLEKTVLPAKLGGDVALDLQKWLQERKSEGK
ncbi:hypothetical protein ACA910_004548 [Epithemia clementina (nom. ined.)]